MLPVSHVVHCCQSVSQACHVLPSRVVSSCVVRRRVVPSSFSQCRPTEAHAHPGSSVGLGEYCVLSWAGFFVPFCFWSVVFLQVETLRRAVLLCRLRRTLGQGHGKFSSSASGEFVDVLDCSSRATPRDGMKAYVFGLHHILMSMSNVYCHLLQTS